ncbi:MAG: hypothetical protein EOO28_23270 [Comamonadaceae bacterium]|nr:MAG: hypothetical protein EOO28_23270 [Comamonadaceae bacterium]
MKKVWINTAAWLAAIAAALTLSFAAPTESSVMGRMPALSARTLSKIPVPIPAGLPAERTLALITFQGAQRAEIESWMEGMKLRDGHSTIAWMRMPVLEDPGDAAGRAAVESRLLDRYPSAGDRAQLVPVFTDRAAFIRQAGLGSPDQVHVVVVNRQGEVLARAGGEFSEDKAQALIETLRGDSQGL